MTKTLNIRHSNTAFKNDDYKLDFLFNPKSIAIVGVSSDPSSPINGMFLYPLLDFDFKGKIYAVNPKGGEIMGLKMYPDIEDIPGSVDHVIAIVPARVSL